MLTCKFCYKECHNKNSLSNHQIRCYNNPERRISGGVGKKGPTGRPSWCKGLTKESDPRVAKMTAHLKGKRFGASLHGHTQETKDKLSAHAKKVGLGGHVQGSGRGKKGWYNGFFCDSSWELAYLIYHLDHGISIERCTEVRTYIWENKVRKYYPDFIVNGKIIEIKGYKTAQWEAKLGANPDVRVLYEKDLKIYIDYVIQKYGKNYINLYEHKNLVEKPERPLDPP